MHKWQWRLKKRLIKQTAGKDHYKPAVCRWRGIFHADVDLDSLSLWCQQLHRVDSSRPGGGRERPVAEQTTDHSTTHLIVAGKQCEAVYIRILQKLANNNIRSFIHLFHRTQATNKMTRKMHVLKVFHRTERAVALTTAHTYTHNTKHKASKRVIV